MNPNMKQDRIIHYKQLKKRIRVFPVFKMKMTKLKIIFG